MWYDICNTIFIQPHEAMKITCYNMVELPKHYAKWNQSYIKEQILCNPIYMRYPTNPYLENRLVVTVEWGVA
jgi:hypothetical protein